ncbi:unnamed protein product [marine sediment metagenome]|uniref:Uncharacterized protein n=1 Tax=marine sediment metagenome TaxID=412755 RepID=X1DYV0_9ZZZZ
MFKDDENILIDGARKMGINLHKEQIKKFSRYLELLVQWNQKINPLFKLVVSVKNNFSVHGSRLLA